MSPTFSGSNNKPKARNQQKQVSVRAVHLWKAQVCIGNRRELQDSLSVPTGSLREWNERTGGKTRITSASPKRGQLCRSRNMGEKLQGCGGHRTEYGGREVVCMGHGHEVVDKKGQE